MMNAPSPQLISFDICPYAERSRILLHEKGVSFTLTNIDLSNKPDWFLELSPRGKVPVLVSGGQAIFESTVINEYLEETHPTPALWPDNPLVKARGRAWIIFISDDLGTASFHHWLKGGETDEHEQALRKGWARIEQALSESDGPFFFGEDFSLVDVTLAPLFARHDAQRALGRSVPADEFPRVVALREAILARESVQKAQTDDLTPKMVDFVRQMGG